MTIRCILALLLFVVFDQINADETEATTEAGEVTGSEVTEAENVTEPITFDPESIPKTPHIPTLHAVMYGPVNHIKNLDPGILLYNLKFLKHIWVSRARKLEVFMTIKGERRFDEITLQELKLIGKFIEGISSYILHKELDCTKEDLINYLGKEKLRKKLLGVIAQCLKKAYGKQVYLNYHYINKFGGVLCGYGEEELSRIDENNFFLVQMAVFVNLGSCSTHQLKALYHIAVKPTVYGKPQGWNKRVARTLGSLLTMVSIEDLKSMQHSSFVEIEPRVLSMMSTEKLEIIKEHLASFRLRSKNIIWRIMGIPSKSKLWSNGDYYFMFYMLIFLSVF